MIERGTLDQASIVQRSWKPMPVIDRGEGIYLWDQEGRRYIDGASGSSAVTNLGHGVSEVVDAMYEQGMRVSYAAPHAFANEPAIRLSQLIAERAPGELRNNCRVWLPCTGTDAVDDAARLARQFWIASGQPSKYLLVGRWQGFHGNNIAVAGFSGHTTRRKAFFPMFNDMPHIPPAYPYRCQFDNCASAGCSHKCARSLETIVKQTGPEHIAAFIAEPVVGAALGAVPAPEGYFEEIRAICDKYEILFIADEVMTGWGRTGRWFGIEHWNVTPDIIATAKGITAGYATLAATIGHERIWATIEASGAPFMAGHTMNHNPVACAAGVATIEYTERNNLVENSRVVGAYLLERLSELRDLAIVGDVRGKGLMCGLEFVRDNATREPYPAERKVSYLVQDAAQARGLLVYACTGSAEGLAGDMLLVMPPLVVTREQIDELMPLLRAAIEDVQASL
jgi:adenosylmethionine-8-amino-7-oxononanoate aminotransferase